MKNFQLPLLSLLFIVLPVSCSSPKGPTPAEGSKATSSGTAKPSPSPTPMPVPGVSGIGKAFHISGNIDDAAQEGDICDVTVPFTVPGTLKFKFTPTSATKGTYTYSGPFNATGSGPYEIYSDGKMLVSGTGCIMGKCATYSHDWKAKPIDPKTCGKRK